MRKKQRGVHWERERERCIRGERQKHKKTRDEKRTEDESVVRSDGNFVIRVKLAWLQSFL